MTFSVCPSSYRHLPCSLKPPHTHFRIRRGRLKVILRRCATRTSCLDCFISNATTARFEPLDYNWKLHKKCLTHISIIRGVTEMAALRKHNLALILQRAQTSPHLSFAIVSIPIGVKIAVQERLCIIFPLFWVWRTVLQLTSEAASSNRIRCSRFGYYYE
jgi:hypothetical protein